MASSAAASSSSSATVPSSSEASSSAGPQEELVVRLAGDGEGYVASIPDGISCPPTCTAMFPRGSTVLLATNATSPAVFTRFAGACNGPSCAITMTASRRVDALFQLWIGTKHFGLPPEAQRDAKFLGIIPGGTLVVLSGGSVWTNTFQTYDKYGHPGFSCIVGGESFIGAGLAGTKLLTATRTYVQVHDVESPPSGGACNYDPYAVRLTMGERIWGFDVGPDSTLHVATDHFGTPGWFIDTYGIGGERTGSSHVGAVGVPSQLVVGETGVAFVETSTPVDAGWCPGYPCRGVWAVEGDQMIAAMPLAPGGTVRLASDRSGGVYVSQGNWIRRCTAELECADAGLSETANDTRWLSASPTGELCFVVYDSALSVGCLQADGGPGWRVSAETPASLILAIEGGGAHIAGSVPVTDAGWTEIQIDKYDRYGNRL
jgi:hypothetical protein